jgi:hypothetical protein
MTTEKKKNTIEGINIFFSDREDRIDFFKFNDLLDDGEEFCLFVWMNNFEETKELYFEISEIKDLFFSEFIDKIANLCNADKKISDIVYDNFMKISQKICEKMAQYPNCDDVDFHILKRNGDLLINFERKICYFVDSVSREIMKNNYDCKYKGNSALHVFEDLRDEEFEIFKNYEIENEDEENEDLSDREFYQNNFFDVLVEKIEKENSNLINLLKRKNIEKFKSVIEKEARNII